MIDDQGERAAAANALSAKLDELCDVDSQPTSVILAALAKTTAIVITLGENPEQLLLAHEKTTRELLRKMLGVVADWRYGRLNLN